MSTTSWLLALPDELLLKIFSHVDQGGYATLCCVSQFLHHIAEPLLYKNVTLVDGRGKPFMQAIEQTPHLATYIEEVAVRYATIEASGCAVAPLLQKCQNLRELQIQSGYWHWNDSEGEDPALYDVESGVEWDDEQQKLCELFHKNSLLTEKDLRILPAFTKCKYDHQLRHTYDS